MYTLQGFFNYSSLVNNALDQVALLGELSSHALTYAKDKTYHSHADAPQTTLVSFHSVRDDSPLEPYEAVVVPTLQVGQYLLDQAMNGMLSSDGTQAINLVMAEFAGVVSDVSVGEMRTDEAIYLPEWIAFTVTTAGEANTVRVWLCDDSFRRQYSEFEIEVVVPFTPLDDFFKDPLQVKVRLDEYDLIEKMNEVQTQRGDYPYTRILAQQYNYQDPLDETWTLPTYWIVLIYGQAGNNIDIIKNAIVEHVLANSTHTREEWTTVLPDLFTATEFIITPLWHQYSVPNRELQAGIYSPTVKPGALRSLVGQTINGPKYTAGWIDSHLEYSLVVYKSLAFAVVGNPDNRDDIYDFSEKFSDYLVVTNDSADFNRMSVRTQEFTVLLSEMIKVAETFTEYSNVPVGMSRLIRNNVVYLTATYENVTYLVVAKPSLEALAGV